MQSPGMPTSSASKHGSTRLPSSAMLPSSYARVAVAGAHVIPATPTHTPGHTTAAPLLRSPFGIAQHPTTMAHPSAAYPCGAAAAQAAATPAQATPARAFAAQAFAAHSAATSSEDVWRAAQAWQSAHPPPSSLPPSPPELPPAVPPPPVLPPLASDAVVCLDENGQTPASGGAATRSVHGDIDGTISALTLAFRDRSLEQAYRSEVVREQAGTAGIVSNGAIVVIYLAIIVSQVTHIDVSGAFTNRIAFGGCVEQWTNIVPMLMAVVGMASHFPVGRTGDPALEHKLVVGIGTFVMICGTLAWHVLWRLMQLPSECHTRGETPLFGTLFGAGFSDESSSPLKMWQLVLLITGAVTLQMHTVIIINRQPSPLALNLITSTPLLSLSTLLSFSTLSLYSLSRLNPRIITSRFLPRAPSPRSLPRALQMCFPFWMRVAVGLTITINVTLMPNITEFDKAIENFFIPVTVLVADAIGGRIEKQHRREFVRRVAAVQAPV